MPNTSARNDYEAGIELVATSDNVVMCRTFSKIHGLAALRLGWMYGPAHVVDAINRIRGPFNVNAPAIAAGIAAIGDTRTRSARASTTTRWLAWLTEEIGKLGLEVTPSVANFVLIHFPNDKGRTATEADAFLTKRGLDPAPGRRLQAAERAAHDGRQRGGQPAGGEALASSLRKLPLIPLRRRARAREVHQVPPPSESRLHSYRTRHLPAA